MSDHRRLIGDGQWRRASRCANAGCAEIRRAGDGFDIRSSRSPELVVHYDADEWEALLTALKAGEFGFSD